MVEICVFFFKKNRSRLSIWAGGHWSVSKFPLNPLDFRDPHPSTCHPKCRPRKHRPNVERPPPLGASLEKKNTNFDHHLAPLTTPFLKEGWGKSRPTKVKFQRLGNSPEDSHGTIGIFANDFLHFDDQSVQCKKNCEFYVELLHLI